MPQEALGIENLRGAMFTPDSFGTVNRMPVDDKYRAVGNLDED